MYSRYKQGYYYENLVPYSEIVVMRFVDFDVYKQKHTCTNTILDMAIVIAHNIVLTK